MGRRRSCSAAVSRLTLPAAALGLVALAACGGNDQNDPAPSGSRGDTAAEQAATAAPTLVAANPTRQAVPTGPHPSGRPEGNRSVLTAAQRYPKRCPHGYAERGASGHQRASDGNAWPPG